MFLSEIYEYIIQHYDHYRYADGGWKVLLRMRSTDLDGVELCAARSLCLAKLYQDRRWEDGEQKKVRMGTAPLEQPSVQQHQKRQGKAF